MSGTTYPSPEFQSLGIAIAAPANGVAGDFSNGSVTATGSSTARTSAARWGDYLNVKDFGADPTGAADSSPAFQAALATGKNVYAPAGTYRLNGMLTIGGSTAQALAGDGLSTILQIDQSFSSTAPAVITLAGTETTIATVRDLWMRFIQPSTVTSRSTFLTLAAGGTSGSGGTGIQYPPAIGFPTANRFRLYRLRISNCWDGIIQGGTGNSGGWFIEDIEISPYSRGLSVGQNLDFSHVRGWHHWAFDMVGQQHAGIQEDGQCYAMKIGDGGVTAQAVNLTDVCVLGARILIDGSGTWAHFENLMMDGGSVFENNNSNWTHISNVYFTPGTAMLTDASIKMTAGFLNITNIEAVNSATNLSMSQTGGTLGISNGLLTTANINMQMISQSGGSLSIRGITFLPTGGSAWNIAAIHVSGGALNFVGNYVHSYFPAPSPAGFLQIDVDNSAHNVDGIAWPTAAYFTPPNGAQGNYGIRRGPQGYSFGLQPTITSSFGGGPTTATIATLSAGGGLHIGSGAVAVIIDCLSFSIAGTLNDNSGQIINSPASGSSLQIPNNCGLYLIETPGIAALTVTLPASPNSNQMLRIWTQGAITNLTLNPSPGQTLPHPVSPFTLNTYSSLLFIYSGTSWLQLSGV